MHQLSAWIVPFWIFAASLVASAAVISGYDTTRREIRKSRFGTSEDGLAVDLYTLSNSGGMVAKITTFGGILTELHVPDRAGNPGDVVLGFDNLKQYLAGHPYFGA